MLWGKIALRGAQIAPPPGWGFPVEPGPADTTGNVGHCPEFVPDFFGGVAGLTAFLEISLVPLISLPSQG